MTYRKLNLDRDKIDHCRNLAERIVAPVARYIERHSTAGIEKASLEIMGVGGSDAGSFVENLTRDELRHGAVRGFMRREGNATEEKIRSRATQLAKTGMAKIYAAGKTRENLQRRLADGSSPLKYAVIDPFNPEAVRLLIERGADIVAFADSPAETDADLLRKILDETSLKAGRYIRMAFPSFALRVSETAVQAAQKGADIFTGDPLSDIFQNGTGMKDAFVDWNFAHLILARAGVTAGTGCGGLLPANSTYRDAHHAFVSLFINEEFSRRAGITPEKISFAHIFDVDPSLDDAFLYELAHAQMAREIFPRSPLRYVRARRGNASNTLFAIACVITEQSIESPGAAGDKDLAPDDLNFILKSARHIGDDITFVPNGKITRRAQTVLENAHRHMRRMESMGLVEAMEKGLLMNTQRGEDGGGGLDRVFQKDRNYFNPVMDILKSSEAISPAEIQTLNFEEAPDAEASPAPAGAVPEPQTPHKKRRRGRRGGRRHRRKPPAAISK